MRRVGAFVACVGLAASLAGCTDYDYIRNGIGTNLSSTDIAVATQVQDAYLGEVCRQAGFRTIEHVLPDGTGVSVCDELSMRPKDWALFVQAGMNDIDRRCDAYLAWLDDKRRSSEPTLKELAKLGAETIAILGAVHAGVKSIAIVGIAFGLSADTFTNINARLSGLEQSTIQATVLGNQRAFRENIADSDIPNRPYAIYLLRGYLRICTPFSIETSINNTITVFHRAPGALAKTDPLFTNPRIVSSTRFSAVTDLGTRIRAYARSSDEHKTEVEIWLKKNAPGMPLAFFIRSGNATQHRKMISDLGIP